MDPIKLYYYTSVPILTCNILFYSMTTLSNSITSTQNVFKFIYEHKDTDIEIFKHELEALDLHNKLQIVEALIFDIIHKYCNNEEEFNYIKENIKNPSITTVEDKNIDYSIININNIFSGLDKIEEPIRYSLLVTSEAIQQINIVINGVHQKILQNNESYVKNFITLNLKQDILQLHKYVKLLDMRLQMLIDLLKIYMPKK